MKMKRRRLVSDSCCCNTVAESRPCADSWLDSCLIHFIQLSWILFGLSSTIVKPLHHLLVKCGRKRFCDMRTAAISPSWADQRSWLTRRTPELVPYKRNWKSNTRRDKYKREYILCHTSSTRFQQTNISEG